MQRSDDERASAQSPTEFLLCVPHSTRQSGGHADVLRVELTKEIFTHGEHDGFRSVVPLIEESAGLPGQVRRRVVGHDPISL